VWTRRRWINASAGAALSSFAARTRAAARNADVLAAAWQVEAGHQVGVLSKAGKTLRIAAAVHVPTRAHGLRAENRDTLLTVARRPGDWMLRWRRDGRPLQWAWIEPDRSFNGHLVASDDGRTLYTTETSLESGHGLIGVRDARSLEKTAEWPTFGLDPHDLLLDNRGCLMVANGGISTRPETGRVKLNIEHMDSSLVCIDTRDGQVRGQWRLDDRRLSLRHLAWGSKGGAGGRLGVALQAEHDDARSKAHAPVLALFDGSLLRVVPAPASVELEAMVAISLSAQEPSQ
jgi:hypothetical protein